MFSAFWTVESCCLTLATWPCKMPLRTGIVMPPATHKKLPPQLHIAHPARGQSWELPLLQLDSHQPGPCIWLTACVHGDEVAGMALIHQLFKALAPKGLQRGRMFALPCANPDAVAACCRNIPSSNEDLNRCFPGNLQSPGQALAQGILNCRGSSG